MPVQPRYTCRHCKHAWEGWSKDAAGKDCHPHYCPRCMNDKQPYMTWENYEEFKLW